MRVTTSLLTIAVYCETSFVTDSCPSSTLATSLPQILLTSCNDMISQYFSTDNKRFADRAFPRACSPHYAIDFVSQSFESTLYIHV